MDKELNLVKILEKVPKGTKLYSLIDGEVTLTDIRCFSKYPIIVTNTTGDTVFTKEGKYREGVGECVLFPSKECKDWNEFRLDLPEGTPVMVSDDKKDWKLRFYSGYKRAYQHGKRCGEQVPWMCIVPVDKFNFTDCSFNKEDNYGTANY